MTYEIISVLCGGPGVVIPGRFPAKSIKITDNQSNRLTPCQAYQQALENSESEILIYIHDDVTIHDPNWLERVLAMWCEPRVYLKDQPICGRPEDIAVIGLGGALRLGHPDLYKRPYHLPDLARGGYMSNQTDAEVHGSRETGVRRVAVVDAFFMAVRQDFLLSIGGWPTEHISHHCLDLWLCCEAARARKEVWMVGASCTHHGGGTSVSPKYREAKWLQGGSMERDHQIPHRWLYDEYRDVLPLEVG